MWLPHTPLPTTTARPLGSQCPSMKVSACSIPPNVCERQQHAKIAVRSHQHLLTCSLGWCILTNRIGSKKLSCSGSRPCMRCCQDGRQCVDVDSSDRTPLTRKRMTELEQRLNSIADTIFETLADDPGWLTMSVSGLCYAHTSLSKTFTRNSITLGLTPWLRS